MGWSLGYDSTWERDIGYGVPAFCDHPQCRTKIDRGLSYVCCESEPYGGDNGCGLYFCGRHRDIEGQCERCAKGRKPFGAKPDHPAWIAHKLKDPSWSHWRSENPAWVKAARQAKNLAKRTQSGHRDANGTAEAMPSTPSNL